MTGVKGGRLMSYKLRSIGIHGCHVASNKIVRLSPTHRTRYFLGSRRRTLTNETVSAAACGVRYLCFRGPVNPIPPFPQIVGRENRLALVASGIRLYP
jgi:hypothetical protein